MTYGHAILTFLAGVLFASSIWAGPSPLGFALFVAFGINGLALALFTKYESQRPSP